ncbi:MAG: fused response regulator/phosphatase [Planctomycetaceae bacterium]|nr:fused response regulator/phosphatase [Planctomycetaceae bacterium]
MRVLVGWDDVQEADLIRLYLNVEEELSTVCTDTASFLEVAEIEPFAFDIVLLATALPDHDAAFAAFQRVRRLRPNCPVVGVCRPDDVYRLAPFLQQGLRASLPRDLGGDFVFLLRATLEGTLEAVRAEADQRAAAMMRRELESVRFVQSAVLPEKVAAPPGYRLAVRYEPSRIEVAGGEAVAIGGDYYDVTSPDENHTTLILADATGHGLRACLSMIALDALLRVLPTAKFRDPAALLNELNRLFCRQKLSRFGGGFVTAVCVVLRHDRHQLMWATAGHPSPLLNAGGHVWPLQRESPPGPPLGVDSDTVYQVETGVIPQSGRLLLFTDGLSEAAPSPRDKQFGTERIARVLQDGSTSSSPSATLENLFTEAKTFAAREGLFDDATALLLERAV